MDESDRDLLKAILSIVVIILIAISIFVLFINHQNEVRIAENLTRKQQMDESHWNDFIYRINSESCDELKISIKSFKSLMDESRPDSATSSFGTWEKKYNASIKLYGEKCNE